MAKEKIKIFELDIDVDAAIQSQSDLKDTLDASREALKKLKKQGDTSSQQYVELEASVKNLSREYNSAQTQLGKMLTLQGKEIKTVKEGEAALTIINKEWSKQAQLFGANSKEADALAKKHAELKERTNNLRKSIGDTSTNVGNYADGMREALGETTLLGQAQQVVTQVFSVFQPVVNAIKLEFKALKTQYVANAAAAKTYSGSQKAAAIATNLTSAALKLFKIALIATGIGAFVVILGSLVAWFSKTQKGIDLVNTVMAALGAGVDVVIDRLARLGGGIAKFLSGDFSGGIDDITSSFEGMGDEIQREIGLAADLERLFQRLQKEQINLDIRRSAANSRLKELKLLTDDTTRSTEDRIASAREYMKIENELADQERENQLAKVAGMLGFKEVTDEAREAVRKIGQEGVTLDQLGISESTIKDMEEFRDEATRLYDLQSQSFERQTEQQNKLNTLVDQQRKKEEAAAKAAIKAREDQIAAAQKATDAAISESKTRLQIFIEEQKGKADSFEEEVQLAEDVKNRKLSILKDELEAKKLTQSEFELANLQTKNEFLEAEAQLIAEYADKKRKAEAIAAQERLDLEALEKERKATDLENKLAIEEENFGARMELERERLEMLRQQELAEAEKTGADVTLINKKFTAAQEKIEQDLQYAKLEMRGQTLGKIKNLFSEESAIGKAFAIAEIANNTVMEATKAFQQAAVYFANPLTIPLGVQAAIQGGIIIATGAAQAAKVVSPKFEEGGLMEIGGKRHSSGGTKFYGEDGTSFEAEQGELIGVVNRNAASMINSLNKAYPMAGAMRANNYLAAGGVVQRAMQGAGSAMSIQQAIDYDLLAQKIGQANMMLPRPVVAVEEINTGQGNYAQVVNGANV